MWLQNFAASALKVITNKCYGTIAAWLRNLKPYADCGVMRPEHPMFNNLQINELRSIAVSIVQSRLWNELPWCDALSGAYPLKPSNSDIEMELALLQEKVTRILKGGALEDEYRNEDEHVRMIYLESALTFSLYRTNENL